MKYKLLFICFLIAFAGRSQQPVAAANEFAGLLNKDQKTKALYPFDVDERYSFHFFPIDNRKGVPLDEIDTKQREAAFKLIRSCLSEQATKKVTEIIQLENVLKEVEHRKPEDHFRDEGKYYFAIFGLPGNNTTWGWRLEGHHVSFNFSVKDGKLVAGTPGFLGANPAIVQSGPKKGTQVLKEETDGGFAMLHALTKAQNAKAVIDSSAPGDIITYINRKAMIEHPAGILYTDLNRQQQEQLLQLINLYVHRYTKLFADDMLKEIQQGGLNEIRFAWAGAQEPTPGKAYYYRIQGPTMIIELDNSQNNANHVHTVLRDLKNDFGGDVLMEHYKTSHQK